MNFSMRRTPGLAFPIALLGVLAACQNPARPSPVSAPVRSVEAPIAAVASPPGVDASFKTWLETARQDALKRGIHQATVTAALTDIAPIAKVIELDNRQPEFTNTFTRYLTNSVTDARVADGQALMQKHAALLTELEHEYGVPGRFLVAFWGLETNFGRGQGDYPVVNALATLAYDGRRGAMFRDEMFNALTILDRGHIALPKMKGSWAGAMGQTQFMPSTFLRYAVDEDHNDHIDIWGSVPDALGSGANYLKSLGWDGAHTWGREVEVPAQFDVALSSLDVDAKEVMKPLSQWAALGIRRIGGGPLPMQEIQASLVLPAGIKGPAFLVYDNYRVILKWNRSAFYAIAVGHLADRLANGEPVANLSREGDPLRRDDVMDLQQGLVTLGFLKTADGVMGSGTRQAVRAFQKANGLIPDGYVDRNIIAAVKAKAA